MSYDTYQDYCDAVAGGSGGGGINMTTSIMPSNLDDLEKDDVLNLLKRVLSERDNLSAELNRQMKKPCLNTNYSTTQPWSAPTPASTQPWSVPAPVAMISPVSPPFDVIGTKKRILKNATAQIKKTVHTNNGKPYTSIVDIVSSPAGILALMNGYEPKTNSNALMRWILDDEEVLDWLNIQETPNIHPVKNKMVGYYPKGCNVYVHAGIESVDIKWSRKSGTLDLKFRTFVAGTGRPQK